MVVGAAGYGGELTPNPDCIVLNLMVTLQTVVSLLLDYSILGLVYARFSSPTLRAGSIRFSKSLFMTLEGGHLVLSTRISNVRRQNVLNPSVRMLLALEMDHVGDDNCDEQGFPLRLVVRRRCACLVPAVLCTIRATSLPHLPTSVCWCTMFANMLKHRHCSARLEFRIKPTARGSWMSGTDCALAGVGAVSNTPSARPRAGPRVNAEQRGGRVPVAGAARNHWPQDGRNQPTLQPVHRGHGAPPHGGAFCAGSDIAMHVQLAAGGLWQLHALHTYGDERPPDHCRSWC